MDEAKLLTEAELLSALNIEAGRTAVWRWRQQGMPHVKIGKAIRYDLGAVREWLKSRTAAGGDEWPWGVWTWVEESRRRSGEIEPAFWFEECRCKTQVRAESIMELFRRVYPEIPICVGIERPTAPPEDSGIRPTTYPVTEEG